MTLKSCWRSLAHGKWNTNRLTSRKFWITLLFFGGMMGFTYLLAAVLGIYSSTVVETGINAIRDVVIAWLGVQGVVDFLGKRNDHDDGGTT